MPTLFRLRRGASSGRPRSRLRRLLGRLTFAAGLLLALSVLAVLALRWIPPITSMMMMERRVGALLAHRDLRIDYRWTRWERISPTAGLAVIAAEDQNFAAHHGFDFESIQKALDARQRGRRLRGASTISQQVAKNIFLWSGRSWVRKGLEAYFTVLVEFLWPKRRILEVYLNIAELGDGVFGVEAASQRYFRKPASRLEPEEAALLAAVLPNPLRFRVGRPSPYVVQRRAWIVQQMWQMGGTAYLGQF